MDLIRGPSGGMPPFAAGAAGIIYTTPGGLRDVVRHAPDRIKKDVVVPQPPLKAKRVSKVNSDGSTINRDTRHPDEAWEFLKLWFEPALLEWWNEMGNTVPPRRWVATSAGFMQKPHSQRIASKLDQRHCQVDRGEAERCG